MTTNDDLLDATIRHQIGLHRYSTHTLRKVVAMLNRIDPRLRAQIKKYDPATGTGSWSRKRLALLLQAVRDIIDEAYIAITDEVDQSVAGLAGYEAEYQKGMIEHVVPAPIVLDIVTPAAPQLYAAVHSKPFAGRLLRDWYAGLADGTKKRVRDAISQGYVEGRTTDQIIRDLMGTKAAKYADGVLEGSRRGIEAMVRTALSHTANTARDMVYEENSSVIKGWVFVATLDSRTTVGCAALDGQVFEIGKGPRPPRHVNCRSSSAPVLRSWAEMGIDLPELTLSQRASMDGAVPASETFDSWLRKKPSEFQADILGQRKAKLFRDGGLSLDRFVDRKGAELTLDQLREREAAAWSKAFG